MKKKRELLFTVTAKDCELETFRAGGRGGQHQNKRDTGVRWRHRPSGAVGECREHRSQLQNKRAAWRRMGESKEFQLWAKMQAARMAGKPSVDELVEKAMQPENLKIEIRKDGKWVEEGKEDA